MSCNINNEEVGSEPHDALSGYFNFPEPRRAEDDMETSSTKGASVKPGVRDVIPGSTQLPSWFLANCVQTFEKLSSAPIPLVLHESNRPEKPKDAKHTATLPDIESYEVQELIYQGLHYTLNAYTSSLEPATDSQSSDSFPGFSNDAAVLRTDLPAGYSGQGFMRAVVQYFAKSQGADLISISKTDMERLCHHLATERGLHEDISGSPLSLFFNDLTANDEQNGSNGEEVQDEQGAKVDEFQDEVEGHANMEHSTSEIEAAQDSFAADLEKTEESEETEQYEQTERFQCEQSESATDKNAFPFEALLAASASPITTLPESIGEHQEFCRPLIIMLPDLKEFLMPPAGKHMMSQLRDAFKDANSTEKRVIVIGMDSFTEPAIYDYQEYNYYPITTIPELLLSQATDLEMVSSLGFDPLLPVIPMLPIHSESQSMRLQKDFRAENRRINIERIQQVALSRLGRSANELLQPYSRWPLEEESMAYRKLGEHSLDASVIELLAIHISKRPSISGVHEAFERLDAFSEWREERNRLEGEPVSRWKDFSKETREAIEEIEGDPSRYEWESMLLEQIVLYGDVDQGWSDIVLEDDLKRAVTQIVNLANADPAAQTELLRQSRINGALLYGPPGTGKTHLARVLAHEYGAVMINVSAADIESKWVGESEKTIKALFNLAAKLSPSIIFIDEADAMFRKRQTKDTAWSRSFLNMFLGQTDGLMKAKRPPFLLLATNHPSDLDEAVLRRVPSRLYIGLPNDQARERIFAILLREEEREPGLDLAVLASWTDGFSGSDLKTLCVQAALIGQAEAEEEKKGSRVLKLSHFETALNRCGPTVSDEALRSIRRFAQDFDPNAVTKIRRATPTSRATAKTNQPSSTKEPIHISTEYYPPNKESIHDNSSTTSGSDAPFDETDIDSMERWRESDLYPYMTEGVLRRLQANGEADKIW